MEFFIKKNATLPILKMQVVKDGRSDYNRMMELIEGSAIFFSMVDVETGIPKLVTRPAGFVTKTLIDPNADPEYYVYYQFTNKDTNKIGRYEGQFLLRNEDGVLILPIRDKLYINIQESFIADDLPYDSCYVSEFPCCINIPVIPVTTTTTTFYPTPTPTSSPLPLSLILEAVINPGSIIINYNLYANQVIQESQVSMNFDHILGVYSGSPITISADVTIPNGFNSGTTKVIILENFDNLSREDAFGNIVVDPENTYWEIQEKYPITPTPTTTPTITPTPTPTNTPVTPTCIDSWEVENFDGTTFRNGDPIPQATNGTEWVDATTNQTGAWCYYNFDSNNGPIYGKLYNWYVVGDPRGIGPNGYIVPSEDDYTSLENCLGGNPIAGGKMKTTGTTEDNTGLWNSPNAGATNESGFSGKPSGVMTDGGVANLLNVRGSFWTNTDIGGGSAMVMNLNNGRTDVYHGPDSKGKGYSIRLKQL
jgi:uncharacterized protein (TIGR02145 family)